MDVKAVTETLISYQDIARMMYPCNMNVDPLYNLHIAQLATQLMIAEQMHGINTTLTSIVEHGIPVYVD